MQERECAKTVERSAQQESIGHHRAGQSRPHAPDEVDLTASGPARTFDPSLRRFEYRTGTGNGDDSQIDIESLARQAHMRQNLRIDNRRRKAFEKDKDTAHQSRP